MQYRGARDKGAVFLVPAFLAHTFHADKIRIGSAPDDPREPSDFPFYRPGVFLASERAARVLNDYFVRTSSIYKIQTEGWFIIVPSLTLDGFDREKSDFTVFEDGKIMQIKKVILRPDFTTEHDVFRLQGDFAVELQVLVSDRFVNAYQRAGLTGLAFRDTSL